MSSASRSSVPDADPQVLITICIGDQAGTETFYRINRNDPLKTVLKAYCKKKEQIYETVTFLHKGQRIHSRQTPTELKLKDKSKIEMMVIKEGGGPLNDVVVVAAIL